MKSLEHIIGLPWQLAENLLQAATIPYSIKIGENYNRFFKIAEDGYYVARVKFINDEYQILLYKPMIMSDFYKSKGVQYAKFINDWKKEKRTT